MVLTDLKTDHIVNLADKLNHQREDGQLCDISIVVGDKKIAAHKCVLVCESDYFKSLTLGPMKQDVSEVDLTSITDDMEHVESVVNYIYTGKIDIQDGNLGCILGLASYLLISKLRQSCIDYMRTRGNMETSVQYYLLANEFMVSELENDFENTIRTRFHDFLIFQKDSLIISPIQLKLLMNNCDIFEHCSVGDIISFVFDWVSSGKTGEHEELGIEILDIAFNSKDRFAKRGTYLHSIEMLEKTKEKLVGENDTDFIAKAKMLVKDCLSFMHNTQPLSINPDKEDPCKEKQAFLPAAADALIAFVPKQPLLDIANDKSVHGIYVYIPMEQTWYSLGDEKDGGLLSRFLSKVKIDDCLGSMLMSDRIYFISNDAFFYTVILRTLKVATVSYKQLVEGIADFNVLADVKFVRSGQQALYLILRINVFMGLDKLKVYFRCYQLTHQNTWNFVFRAPLLEDGYIDTEVGHRLGTVSALVTEDSTKMLLVYKADQLHVFVVDMNSLGTPQVMMQYHTASLVTSSFGISILQRKQRLFFVERFRNEGEEDCMICKYAYNWRQRKIVKIAKTEITLKPLDVKYLFNSGVNVIHNNLNFCVNDSENVWFFEGNRFDGSSLRSVSFDESVRLKEHTHTPPPFSCAATLAAGPIRRDLLNSPITKYLIVRTT